MARRKKRWVSRAARQAARDPRSAIDMAMAGAARNPLAAGARDRYLRSTMRRSKWRLELDKPNVIGTVLSQRGLRLAKTALRAGVDGIEIRADAFELLPKEKELLELEAPIVVTVRRFDEGGATRLRLADRCARYARCFSAASAVDVEVRSAPQMEAVLAEARDRGVLVILSYHHFQRTPPLPRLRQMLSRARAAGANVFKVATYAATLRDVGILVGLLSTSPMPAAVMGMGPFGKVSRLVLAKGGSALNYGWIEQPQVSGQWSALELVARIRELG